MHPEALTDQVLALPTRIARKSYEDTARRHSVADVQGEWREILNRTSSADATVADQLVAGFLKSYATIHGGDGRTAVVFWAEDFVSYFLDLAEAAGINLDEYGRKLDPAATHPEYVLGFAFRALCEIEGYYSEVPGACIACTVPRAFLITLSAAMIGIATHQAELNNPLLAGGLSGVGSLLVSILANRFTAPSHFETDWLEELVLRTLEQSGRQTAKTLYEQTHIEQRLLQKVLRRLVERNLVVEIRHWTGSRESEFKLPSR